jgi:hypothetical protein
MFDVRKSILHCCDSCQRLVMAICNFLVKKNLFSAACCGSCFGACVGGLFTSQGGGKLSFMTVKGLGAGLLAYTFSLLLLFNFAFNFSSVSKYLPCNLNMHLFSFSALKQCESYGSASSDFVDFCYKYQLTARLSFSGLIALLVPFGFIPKLGTHIGLWVLRFILVPSSLLVLVFIPNAFFTWYIKWVCIFFGLTLVYGAVLPILWIDFNASWHELWTSNGRTTSNSFLLQPLRIAKRTE